MNVSAKESGTIRIMADWQTSVKSTYLTYVLKCTMSHDAMTTQNRVKEIDVAR